MTRNQGLSCGSTSCSAAIIPASVGASAGGVGVPVVSVHGGCRKMGGWPEGLRSCHGRSACCYPPPIEQLEGKLIFQRGVC